MSGLTPPHPNAVRCPDAPALQDFAGVAPRRIALAKNEIVYRIHPRKYAPDGWYAAQYTYDGKGNPTGQGNRWDPLGSPFENRKVLYAGDSMECAIAERLLRWHDRGISAHGYFSPSEVDGLVMSQLLVKRELSLIELSGLGLQALAPAAHPFDRVLICPSADYPKTQAWAAWLVAAGQRHMRNTAREADGFAWRSRQNNDRLAYLLFEDACSTDVGPEPQAISHSLEDPASAAHQTLLAELAKMDLEWDGTQVTASPMP